MFQFKQRVQYNTLKIKRTSPRKNQSINRIQVKSRLTLKVRTPSAPSALHRSHWLRLPRTLFTVWVLRKGKEMGVVFEARMTD
jgi:hypothetical protein